MNMSTFSPTETNVLDPAVIISAIRFSSSALERLSSYLNLCTYV